MSSFSIRSTAPFCVTTFRYNIIHIPRVRNVHATLTSFDRRSFQRNPKYHCKLISATFLVNTLERTGPWVSCFRSQGWLSRVIRMVKIVCIQNWKNIQIVLRNNAVGRH